MINQHVQLTSSILVYQDFISLISTFEMNDWVENLYEGARYSGPPSDDIKYLLHVELGILTFLDSGIRKE